MEFLEQVARAPRRVHLVVDNYGTHKTPTIRAWLAETPPVPDALHPTCSSWLNQVVRHEVA